MKARNPRTGEEDYEFAESSRGVVAAEAMRLRLGDRFQPPLYALAADAIVNETLLLAGHVLPRPCVLLSALLLVSGLFYFRRMERSFADVV